MKHETQQLLARAAECIDHAERSLAMDMDLVAVNRAYYAVFDAARAMLFERGYPLPKTHSGTQSRFSEIFVKTGEAPIEMSSAFVQLFNLRQMGDYDFSAQLDEHDAEKAVELARQFLVLASGFFGV